MTHQDWNRSVCLKYVDIGRQGMKLFETFEILSVNFTLNIQIRKKISAIFIIKTFKFEKIFQPYL